MRVLVTGGAGFIGSHFVRTLLADGYPAYSGAEVTVYDAMPSVGRKFLLAGRGGLNLTHSEALPGFLTRYGTASSRLATRGCRFVCGARKTRSLRASLFARPRPS